MDRHPTYNRVPLSNPPTEPTKTEPETQTSLLSGSQHKLDDEQSTEIPRASRWESITVDTWMSEFIALALSVGCLCAIVAVLYTYHNAPVPHLPPRITLNAIISTLGTGSRSLLLYVTAASLGQLKWCWFHNTRRLRDMEYLDRASRGPTGSFWVFSRISTMPLMALGALVMITALAFDPFIQQVVRYQTRPATNVSSASQMPQAPNWYPPPLTSGSGESTSLVMTPMDGATSGLPFFNAINTGIWSNSSQIKVQPTCAGSSCEWQSFQSTGWCSKCVDAMPYASITNCDIPSPDDVNSITEGGNWTGCSVDFGHGNTFDDFLHYQSQWVAMQMDGSWGLIMEPTTAAVWLLNDAANPLNTSTPFGPTFLGVEHPLLVLAYVRIDAKVDETNTSYTGMRLTHAEECVLSLCERNYTAALANGSLQVTELSTNFGHLSQVYTDEATNPYADEGYKTTRICWQAQPGLLAPPYSSANGSAWALVDDQWVDTPYSGTWWNDTVGGVCPGDAYGPVIANLLVGNASTSNAVSAEPSASGPAQLDTGKVSSDVMARILTTNLSTILDGIAASLTLLNFETSNHTVTGNVTYTESYVHVTWEWLILPWVLEILGLMVLLAAIVQSSTQKTDVWRTSILPLLFHGLEDPSRAQGETSNKLSSMRHAAEGRLVRLGSSRGEDERTVLASQMGGTELI